MKTLISLWLLGLVALAASPASRMSNGDQPNGQEGPGDQNVVRMTVHADRPQGRLHPIWRFFGYDEANYTFAPDGSRLLTEIARLEPQPATIRMHHLLTSGDGQAWLKWSSTNAYSEGPKGNPIYDWSVLDRIFDTLQERRLRPFVEIAFMPLALTTHPDNYTPDKVLRDRPRGSVGGGAFYPPKDYAKWESLVEAWVRHCVGCYGREEVANWYWELWNEPDIGYWKGTLAEYLKLYDHTAAAIRRVLPEVRVGGPHVTNPTSDGSERYLRAFIEHCLRGTNSATGGTGAPIDFVAFHAKGGTSFVDGHVRMNLPNHLRTIDRGCEIVASYPELKGIGVIIGESDPDGCAACSSEFYPQNAYRNGSQYASYTAATFMRKQAVAERHGVNLEGAVTWAFAFEDQPWFAGFRTLSTNGVAKPVLNAFRLFSLLEQQRVATTNSARRDLTELMKPEARASTDIDVLATRGRRALSAIVWHHHDDGVSGPARTVALTIEGLPKDRRQARLTHYRIDDRHSNAYTAWLAMGSPQDPTPEQVAVLKSASELGFLEPTESTDMLEGTCTLQFELPRHAVSLVHLQW